MTTMFKQDTKQDTKPDHATPALDDNHLIYPHRAYGMDQGHYAWRTPDARPRLEWPEGRLGKPTLACLVVVPIEHHALNPAGKPFKHPGAMVTPYPDLRHYTSRDYGNRVGVYRLLKVLKDAGVKATFPINAMALSRLAPLVQAIAEDGHEVAAYGLGTDHIHWGGLDPAVEAGWIAETRHRFAQAGLHPGTWLSPARQQSFATLDLIAEAGFDICLDWEHDTVPVAMATRGGPVTALPLSNELDDRTLLIDRRQSECDWTRQVLDAVDFMKAEHPRRGGQALGFTLTPYVAGQPFRIAALRHLLGCLGQDSAVWCATAGALVEAAQSSA